jgi:hypothetical protein
MKVHKKIAGYIEIDGYKVFTSATERSVNPEATIEEIVKKTGKTRAEVFQLKNYRELFNENKIYFEPGANQKLMDAEEADALVQTKESLTEDKVVLIDKRIIPNFAGKEYHKKNNNKWERKKIKRLGEMPDGPLPEELTPEQQEEIRLQEDETRICCMAPEEKEKAIQGELDAYADEAARLERRNQIQGKAFDAVAWYKEKEAAVRQKYSVTHEDAAIA